MALSLTNLTSVLTNARVLPDEISKTAARFDRWYGDHDGWKGHWTNHPEGLVDMAELGLTAIPFRIDIDRITSGKIEGTIETKGICDRLPLFESLLVDGSISSSRRATIRVFDYLGGYRRDFAELRLERDGHVMRVLPATDSAGLFVSENRIARDPEGIGGPDNRDGICPGKRARHVERFIRKAGHPQARRQHVVPD